MGTSIHEQVDIKQVKSSRKYSWYGKIRVGDWWNRTQVVKQDVSRYNIVMLINRKSDVKPHGSKLSKAYNGYTHTHIVGIFYYYYSSYPDI